MEKLKIDLAKVYRIRITLSSTEVRSLEKVCADLIAAAKQKKLHIKGPVRMPTRCLRIVTRKTPCGEGSKTFDRFQVKRKRVPFALGYDSTNNIVYIRFR